MEYALGINNQETHQRYAKIASAASKRIIEIWENAGFNLQPELLFPNDKLNHHPYSVDVQFIDFHFMVEIDGYTHIKTVIRDQIRDTHIEKIASSTGHDCHIIRLPLIIPPELIFGNLRGDKRKEVKAEYGRWLENWARVELASLPNRLRLAKLKNQVI